MRQSFRRGFLAGAVALFVGLNPAQAEPIEFADFAWKNRLLIACDLQRPSYASDLSAALSATMLSDPANARQLRVGLIASDGWILYAPSAAGNDRAVPMIGAGCVTETCREIYPETERAKMIARLACTPDQAITALIGLDGRIKKIWHDTAPTRDEVFALIDAMPMRAAEIALTANGD